MTDKIKFLKKYIDKTILFVYNKDNKKLFITPNKKFVDYFYGGKQWRKSNGF